MTYEPPTDPANVAKVLDNGLSLFQASFKSVYLPAFWLGLAVGLIHWGQIPFRGIEEEASLGMGDWLRLPASLVASTYMYGVIAAIVHYVASGAPRGVRSPLAVATRRFPALLAVFTLYGLAVIIGPLVMVILVLLGALLAPAAVALFTDAVILLTLVPVIFLAVALFASFLLAIAEGYGPINSLRGSYAMVKGRWWPTFAVVAATTVVSTAMSFASNAILVFLAESFDSDIVSNAASTLAYAAFLAIIAPLTVCLFYGAYQDLRLRQTPRHDVRPTD